MAILKIITEENETLRKKSKPVTEITPRILTLLDDMKETLIDADGVGLAAAISDADAPFVNREGQREPEFQGWMPVWRSGPHEHRPIPTPISTGAFEGSKRMVTVLYPYEGESSPIVAVKASGDVEATDFEIILRDGTRRTFRE